jgi:uncharacterized protein
MRVRAAAILLAAFVLVGSSRAESVEFPRSDGYVNDFAGVLDESAETYLEGYLSTLERDTSAEVAVVTVGSLDGLSVEEYASRLFAAWGIGQRDRDNGVLLLVAPEDRVVRIEVGYGLEGTLPDGLAGEIIRRDILPEFRAGNIPRGIGRGLDRIARIVRGETAAVVVVPPAQTVAGDDTPSAWILVPFLGFFVVLGAFVAGVGVRAKTFGLLIWGVGFAGIPLVMAAAFSPVLTLTVLAPLAFAAAVAGHRKAHLHGWTSSARAGSPSAADRTAPSHWIMGGSSDASGGSSGDSSSSSDFGGGSSGGGGATGRW